MAIPLFCFFINYSMILENWKDFKQALRDKEKHPYITYYHPRLQVIINQFDTLSVVCYQKEMYLMFESGYNGYDDSYSTTIYSIQNGQLTGQYKIQSECSTIHAKTTYCTKEMEEKAKRFCQKAEDYYRANVYDTLFQGNVEKEIPEGSKEEQLLKTLGKEEKEEQEETYKDKNLLFGSVTVLSGAMRYQSDLDNDGKAEIYAKGASYLGMCTRQGALYKTGKLYGNGEHEGKWGLWYLIGDNGIRTYFENLCGLELWATDGTPQIFWVERCGEENITFIKYYDSISFRKWIDGYRIQEGRYEKVMSVEYQPEVILQTQYDWKTEEEIEDTLTYTVYLEEKDGIDYPRLYGLNDTALQKEIEANIERFFEEEVIEIGEKLEWKGSALYEVIAATQEKVVLNYQILYEFGNKGRAENIYMEINLKTGEVILSEDWEKIGAEFRKKKCW